MNKAILFFITILSYCQVFAQPLEVVNLQCEYHSNPLGIENPRPQLCWQLNASQRNIMQSRFARQKHRKYMGFKKGKLGSIITNCLFRSKAFAGQRLYGKISSAWKKNSEGFELNVEIPANTTATIYLPAKRDDIIIESGHPVNNSTGLQFLRHEQGKALIAVSSGHYVFKVKHVGN
jgi:hypothetical protein